MIFITAGMWWRNRNRCCSEAASIAKELGALTPLLATKPFDFEGPRRRRNAEEGIEELKNMLMH